MQDIPQQKHNYDCTPFFFYAKEFVFKVSNYVNYMQELELTTYIGLLKRLQNSAVVNMQWKLKKKSGGAMRARHQDIFPPVLS